MAKAFLMRTQSQELFNSTRLEFREPGFTKDTERFYMGGLSKNLHIPNEDYVTKMIGEHLASHGPKMGTTAQLSEHHVDGTFAYNTETGSLSLMLGETPVPIAFKHDTPSRAQVDVVVEAAHISSEDGSVLITDFRKGVFMIFVDGILCTTLTNSAKRYAFDNETKRLKVFGCVEGSVISYF